MSNLAELLTGITLLIISLGTLAALHPRKGQAFWWVKKPFVGPSVTILIVAGFAIGAILLASYFTTIDEIKLLGKV